MKFTKLKQVRWVQYKEYNQRLKILSSITEIFVFYLIS